MRSQVPFECDNNNWMCLELTQICDSVEDCVVSNQDENNEFCGSIMPPPPGNKAILL